MAGTVSSRPEARASPSSYKLYFQDVYKRQVLGKTKAELWMIRDAVHSQMERIGLDVYKRQRTVGSILYSSGRVDDGTLLRGSNVNLSSDSLLSYSDPYRIDWILSLIHIL